MTRQVERLAQSAEANRRRLGRELRLAREAADRTQAQAAALLNCKQGKISKIEGAHVNIKAEDLDQLAHYYRLSESKTAELRELHRNSTVPQAVPGYPAHFRAFVELVSVETDATEILSWHSERIPGPLQHPRYMLKQFELDQPEKRGSVQAALDARKSRLNIFTVDNAPSYQVILSESSLHRLPGGWSPEFAVDQITHLLMLRTKYKQFELRIIPFRANLACADADFAVLRFQPEESAAAAHRDFVYLEHVADAEIVTDLTELTKFLEYWDTLGKAALSCDGTVAFLEQRIYELMHDRNTPWP